RLPPGLEVVAAADPVEPGALGGHGLLQQLAGRELLVRCAEEVFGHGLGLSVYDLANRLSEEQRLRTRKDPEMAGKLDGLKIAFIAADGVEQVELTEPWKAVEAEGAKPELLSVEGGEIQDFNHLDKGDTFKVDHAVSDADASDYAGIVLPGGVANPDFLRTNDDVVSFIRSFFDDDKPAAVICHG